MKRSKTTYVAGGYLLLCLLLGGASAAGVIANALLQIIALVLILWVMWRRSEPADGRAGKALLLLLAAAILLGLLSLVPLPPSLWRSLPGREPTAYGFALMGMAEPWLPLSLARDRTVASLLSLLPPLAIFLMCLRLQPDGRRALAWLLLGFAAFSIILSAFQLIGGPGSALRFYAVTNPTRAVGFFASANHLPTLILCALPVAGILAAAAITSRSKQKKSGGLTVAVAAALFLAIGIAVSQSGAGYALFVPAALASFLIYRKASVGRVSRAWGIGVAVLFIGFVAVGVFGPLGKESLSDNFSEHPTSRSTIWEVTVKAATAFSPVGSGLGSFSGAYRTFDDPDRAGNQFVNHAHNDYLEIALELGVPGLLLVAAFLLWFGIRAVRVWSDDFRGATLGRLGSVIIAVVLIHSFVDYPLRTAAIQALFAMACAFLVPPPNRRKQARDQTSEGSELRHLEAD